MSFVNRLAAAYQMPDVLDSSDSKADAHGSVALAAEIDEEDSKSESSKSDRDLQRIDLPRHLNHASQCIVQEWR